MKNNTHTHTHTHTHTQKGGGGNTTPHDKNEYLLTSQRKYMTGGGGGGGSGAESEYIYIYIYIYIYAFVCVKKLMMKTIGLEIQKVIKQYNDLCKLK